MSPHYTLQLKLKAATPRTSPAAPPQPLTDRPYGYAHVYGETGRLQARAQHAALADSTAPCPTVICGRSTRTTTFSGLSGVIFSMLTCISETVSRVSTFPLRPHIAQLWSSVGVGLLRDEQCSLLLWRVTGIGGGAQNVSWFCRRAISCAG